MLPVNMGPADRLFRSVVVAPALIVIAGVVGPVSVLSIILYVLAAVMLLTSAVASCPLYLPVKMNTCSRKNPDSAARA
ncbi:MAG: DUF2892 domain-containing protein [Thermoleophilia bacterium]